MDNFIRQRHRPRLLMWGVILLLLLAACSPAAPAETDDSSEPATEKESEDSVVTGETPAAGDPSKRLPTSKYADLEIVTLLPRDAIPAIDDPKFLTADEADSFYDPTELVLGVDINGEARAYSVPFLSGHEIVNDTVGGVKIAVTW